jgi:hypothetical protein
MAGNHPWNMVLGSLCWEIGSWSPPVVGDILLSVFVMKGAESISRPLQDHLDRVHRFQPSSGTSIDKPYVLVWQKIAGGWSNFVDASIVGCV